MLILSQVNPRLRLQLWHACVQVELLFHPWSFFDRKTLNPELTRGEVLGTIYGLSPKGWINRELFLSWFYKHFLALIPPARPVLLLLDGHSSHYSPDVIRLAAKEKVIIFILPPNTTRITQPLDSGCFSPLKSQWRRVCHEFCSKNPDRIVSRYDFSALFSTARRLSMTPGNIISSFRVVGVHPFTQIKLFLKSVHPSMSKVLGQSHSKKSLD